MKYKLFNNSYSNTLAGIIATDEVNNLTYTIPLDANNRHYAEYLEWVAAGNTAEAAD